MANVYALYATNSLLRSNFDEAHGRCKAEEGSDYSKCMFKMAADWLKIAREGTEGLTGRYVTDRFWSYVGIMVLCACIIVFNSRSRIWDSARGVA